MPSAGGKQEPRGTITPEEVGKARRSLEEAFRKEPGLSREALLEGAEARRALARELAEGFAGREPADASVALDLAGIFGLAGRREEAAALHLRYLRSVEQVQESPPRRLSPEATEAEVRAHHAWRAATAAVSMAPCAAGAREAVEEALRVFPRGGILASPAPLLSMVGWKALEGAPASGLGELARQCALLLVPERREAFRTAVSLFGKPAPPLAVEHTVGPGAPGSLEDLAGKVVLLDFFAFWCGPCKAVFPHLRDLVERHAEDGLAVVGVTYFNGYFSERSMGVSDDRRSEGIALPPERELEYLAAFREHYRCDWPFVVEGRALRGEGLAVTERRNFPAWGVTGIPHVVLLDRGGRVRYAHIGSGNPERLEEAVRRLLAEGSPAGR